MRLRGALRVASIEMRTRLHRSPFSSQATGRASINLDTFLMGRDGVKEAFSGNLAMPTSPLWKESWGCSDGIRPDSLSGSSAEIAALLDLPVILAVNARGISGSIAPLVRGFSESSPV
ncbi:MAG: hypothetical protein V8T87_15125 [Victivallales bacterium]